MDTHDHAMTHTAAVKQSKLTLAWQQLTQKPAVRWLRNNALVLVAIPWAVTVSYWALSATTAPNIPVIPLSADPLYAATGGDKPLLALALSVEFPTVGAQYLDPANATGGATQDGSYSNSSEYLGYYDAESCYTYNKSPTETPVSPQTASDFKRFDRIGPAIALTTPDPSQPLKTSRKCTDAFSGNFLNWASSSAIDMLRLALTGGYRYIDTPTLTILQRAVLPHDGNGFPSGYARFWNSTNFPGKQLLRSGGSSGTAFFGAVPNAMVTAAGTNDIWVVNELNKIYFGTSKVGSDSGSAGSYTLGGPVSGGSGVGTVVNPYQTPSTALTVFQSGASNFTECPHTLQSGYSSEGLVCSFSGTKEVLYGAPPGSPPAGAGNPGGWLTYVATGGVTCGNTMTGSTIDPIQGVYKRCYYRDYTAPPTSTTLNDDGFFYARVQVCDRNPSTYALNDVRDYGLCKTYSDGQTTPHASYKPTGVIQKYSDQLRIAVFGYLMDQVDSRYGGVLRAPVKYVGAKTFDTSGVELGGTNANMEWNATTGVCKIDCWQHI
jgi:type IV pilus assembly protein PilY1